MGGGRGGKKRGDSLCRCMATSENSLPSDHHFMGPRPEGSRRARQKEDTICLWPGGRKPPRGQEDGQTCGAKWDGLARERTAPPLASRSLLLPLTGSEHKGSNATRPLLCSGALAGDLGRERGTDSSTLQSTVSLSRGPAQRFKAPAVPLLTAPSQTDPHHVSETPLR